MKLELNGLGKKIYFFIFFRLDLTNPKNDPVVHPEGAYLPLEDYLIKLALVKIFFYFLINLYFLMTIIIIFRRQKFVRELISKLSILTI